MYIHILRRMRELNGCAWISNFAKKKHFLRDKKDPVLNFVQLIQLRGLNFLEPFNDIKG